MRYFYAPHTLVLKKGRRGQIVWSEDESGRVEEKEGG